MLKTSAAAFASFVKDYQCAIYADVLKWVGTGDGVHHKAQKHVKHQKTTGETQKMQWMLPIVLNTLYESLL